MGKVVGAIICLALGVFCVVVGVGMIDPPELPHGSELHALGDALGRLLGWPVLIFGVVVLCCVLGYVYASWRELVADRDAPPADPRRADLPEARVRSRTRYSPSVAILDWFRRRKAPPLVTAPPRPPCHPLLVGATSVRIRRPGESAVLFESAQVEDLTTLGEALDAEAVPNGYCMCIGTLDIDVQRTSATPVTLSLHHGVSLRWKDSKGNVSLRSPDAIMDWLSARGINFVREEYEESEKRGEETLAQKRGWHDALPSSLRPFLDDMQTTGATTRPAWTAAIEQEFPDPIKRAAALIELFGSGVGPWSGYPSWERVPEELLLAMPLDVLLAAIGTAPGERLLEGSARLFGGWSFRKTRRKDLQRLPANLRTLLLEHVAAIGDEDKVFAVRRAFEEKKKGSREKT